MRLWIILFACLLPSHLFAQTTQGSETTPVKDSIFTLVEVMPCWKNCKDYDNEDSRMECTVRELTRFITKKIKYPNKARKNNITGTVYIGFVVDQTGKIEDVRILKTSTSPLLDEAALKAINKMPDWIPGIQRGKNVKVQFNIPVSFRLPG